MTKWTRSIKRSRWHRSVVPLVVFLLMCYGLWAYCGVFCYAQVHKELGHTAAGAVFMVVHVVLTVVVAVIWVQIVVLGPGRQPVVPPFRIVACDELGSGGGGTSVAPPAVYQCDSQGYPVWCSACQSLKIERAHHSAVLGHCIPRFDHYCIWLGTAIGRRNHRLFIQFFSYVIASLVFDLATVAAFLGRIVGYGRAHEQEVNKNTIALLVLVLVILVNLVPMALSFVYHMFLNRTSIEALQAKKKHRTRETYFCVYNPADQYRYVVRCLAGEELRIWRKRRAWDNVKEFMGPNCLMWVVPIGTQIRRLENQRKDDYYSIVHQYAEELGEWYKALLMDRIKLGEYVTRLRVSGDFLNQTQDDGPIKC